tara:strand:+ start:979 stop:1092 length:114 start_codon:yes stop_codon:yes gene_type:complete
MEKDMKSKPEALYDIGKYASGVYDTFMLYSGKYLVKR